MCTAANFAKITRASAAIIAYKVVTPLDSYSFVSMYLPVGRSYEPGFKTYGKLRRYIIGKTHQSTLRSTPGFYCYKYYDDARTAAAGYHHILKVRIPAGTKIVEGGTDHTRYPSINCEKLVVLEQVT